MTGAEIRVALVDDQQLVRGGFGMLIGSQPDLVVVGEAGDGLAAIELLEGTPADVVLMDVRMPGMNGIDATRAILERPDPPRVIVLTTFDLDDYVLEAIRAGASGFLLKDAEPEELLRAIRSVHRGDAVISPSMTRRLLSHVGPMLGSEGASDPARTADGAEAAAASGLVEMAASLTAREREVLELVAQGMSNAEIAAALVLSETTVKTHVRRILAKTASRDRVQAVVFAYEAGIVAP
ncbi:response regulator transcription factor [Leucobacter weissii]|uniref:Response regulator transcription factor n=1 Tax=Leucobacter weissii TaxID=1983706 RepID=A0A939MP66_9MICO|nr:response regulator transcription factor [Leucobacter weissii]MBO1900514.1 response regulator transcription factor [Leucobacter weissii]